MSKLGAENWLAAGAVWLLIMLPSAAFGRDGIGGLDAVGIVSAGLSSLGLVGH